MARKGQRVVARVIALDRWALRRSRREGAAEAWSVLPTGQAGVQPACGKLPKLAARRIIKLGIFPVQGKMVSLVSAGNFSVPKHGKFPPRKAAIRWLVTASEGGRFERIFEWEVAKRRDGGVVSGRGMPIEGASPGMCLGKSVKKLEGNGE